MKSKTKFLKTFVTLVLLMLAVFSFVNASFSFFTSANSTQGNIKMADMSVSFRYKVSGYQAGELEKGSSITFVPTTPFIERGVAFNLKLVEGDTSRNLEHLSIIKQSGQCDAYVRFWIEAYRLKNDNSLDKTEDYGRFFFLTRRPLGSNNFSRAESEPYCYYIEKALYDATDDPLEPTDPHMMDLGIEMTLTDIKASNGTLIEAVPIDLLGERIQITISFQAVQKANEAFKSVFNDDKGYYSKWT